MSEDTQKNESCPPALAAGSADALGLPPHQVAHAFCPGSHGNAQSQPPGHDKLGVGASGGGAEQSSGRAAHALPARTLPPHDGHRFYAPQMAGLNALLHAGVAEAEGGAYGGHAPHMSRSLVTFEQIMSLSHLPIDEAARQLGVCTTVVKRVCRWNGVDRWPFRKIQGLTRKINTLTILADNGTATRQQKLTLARHVRRRAPAPARTQRVALAALGSGSCAVRSDHEPLTGELRASARQSRERPPAAAAPPNLVRADKSRGARPTRPAPPAAAPQARATLARVRPGGRQRRRG